MTKSLTILSISLLLSTAAHGMQPTEAKVAEPTKKEAPIVEPGLSTWLSDKVNGIETNVLYELENKSFDARSQKNIKRLENAIEKCISSKQYTTLSKIYILTKRQNILVEDAQLNQKACELLNTYKNEQDDKLFGYMLKQLTQLHDETKAHIQMIKNALNSHVKNIQETANGLRATHFQQGVQTQWTDKTKQIIKRNGLIASLAALKTLEEALPKL